MVGVLLQVRLGGSVLGIGAAGVDFLASVKDYPQPDAKIRTEVGLPFQPFLHAMAS